MSGIQLVLISGVLGIFLYYIFRLQNALLDLLTIAVLAGLAVFFILFPDYTNTIAEKLGVGRGADLLFYICILFFLFIVLKIIARIRRLEQMITELIRQQAKLNAISPEEDSMASKR